MGPRKPDMNIGQHVNAVSHLKSTMFFFYIKCEIFQGLSNHYNVNENHSDKL